MSAVKLDHDDISCTTCELGFRAHVGVAVPELLQKVSQFRGTRFHPAKA